MLINFASNKTTTPDRFYIAVVAIDQNNRGKLVFRDTDNYRVEGEGKYWVTLTALHRVAWALKQLQEKRDVDETTPITIALPSKVIMGWFFKGKAVEPYRVAFDRILREFEVLDLDIEFVQENTKSNKAKYYACEKYMPDEEYESCASAFEGMGE